MPLVDLTGGTAVKVLVVDDEKDITALVAYHLEREGFTVLQAHDGLQALELVKRERPSLLVLDLMLPHLSGLDVCRRLRKEPDTARLPILMLTAKAEETDKVLGLELGGDDYLTKPFGPKELVARVKALIRRSEEVQGGEVVKAGSLEIDLDRYTVTIRKRAVELTPKEFDLLKALVLAKGRVLTRDYLLDRVWGYERASEIESRTVDVHVRRLREKLGSEAARIVTVKSVGYRFDQDS
jgi:two-component system alkaline phosphatase synthesis response regulator PhoP